ncbi:MAG: serine hydrolase domain-containing protein [Bacteroidota bacterium]
MKNTFILLAIAFIHFSCGGDKPSDSRKAPLHSGKIDSLKTELTNALMADRINGFGACLVNEDGTVFAQGFGYANKEIKTAYTNKTLQNIGSVSKTLIGIALLKAQELGKLNLDDPINDHLPYEVSNPNYPSENITIRQLATHTSSIIDAAAYDSAYVLRNNVTVPDSIKALTEAFRPNSAKVPLKKFLRKILSKDGSWYSTTGFLQHSPGQYYEYTNVGSALAAAIIEYATGQSYDQFTTEHILKPLGMHASGWSLDVVDTTNHSVLYAKMKTPLPYYSLITYPDGGFITNPQDMGKYLSELVKGYVGNGTILNQESYREIFQPQLSAANFLEERSDAPDDDEYNTGIFMGFTPTGLIGHTGGDPGIATYMFFDPDSKTGRILMINTSVRDNEGVEQFYHIWGILEKYQRQIN